MRLAIEEAGKAFTRDEVPVGAVVVAGDTVIARAHNLTVTLNDPTAHAEMQAITSATEWLGSRYLNECTVYVTLEPCAMCAGALFWSQAGTVVFGCSDPKKGYSLVSDPLLHPATIVRKGVLESECSGLLSRFFSTKR
ncbi:MAG: nucleoside deaminase [Bacteroidetes bacterium]|nr:nucleoside deaminase [Bacteroidota bacterium]